MDPLIRFHHSTLRVGVREDVRRKKLNEKQQFAPRVMQIRRLALNSHRFVVVARVFVVAAALELSVVVRITVLLKTTFA